MPTGPAPSAAEVDETAGERYLLLADISGYTTFLSGVEREHGVDFSGGIPAAYGVLGALLDGVIDGIAPDFSLVKLEGDAIFAQAPAGGLDGRGDHVLDTIAATYREFVAGRTRAIPSKDHLCTACPAVARLDLKVVLHRGATVRQRTRSGEDFLGPAVIVAHRMLKNTVQSTIGNRPYLFMSDAALTGLGLSGVGIAHSEDYSDAGRIHGRIVELRADR